MDESNGNRYPRSGGLLAGVRAAESELAQFSKAFREEMAQKNAAFERELAAHRAEMEAERSQREATFEDALREARRYTFGDFFRWIEDTAPPSSDDYVPATKLAPQPYQDAVQTFGHDLLDALFKAVASGEISQEAVDTVTRKAIGREKPGPKPRTMEEVKEIVERWRKWQQMGLTQQVFCERQGWESRTILSDCLRRYRAKYGRNSI
jgi:hypothetical protein